MVFAKVNPNAPILDYWIPPSEQCPEQTEDEYSEGSDIFCTGPDSDDEYPHTDSFTNGETEEPPNEYTQSDFEDEEGLNVCTTSEYDQSQDNHGYAEAYTEQEMSTYYLEVERDENDQTGYTDEQGDFIHGIEDEYGEFWHGYCSDGGGWHHAYYDDDGEWYSEANDEEAEEEQEDNQSLDGDSQLRYEEGYDDAYPPGQ